MLSIGKLSPGRAAYYVEQLPGGADEYYTAGSAEEPAVWLGRAAERLGLDGPVGPESFRRLLDARHPASGEPLGVPASTGRRLAGFDLCLSAPKSLSVAWALGPPEVAAAVAGAHDRAVAATVAVFETEAVRARRGAGGTKSITTEGVMAAAFAHRSSRAGDPQLHTHVVVPNLTLDRSGRWSALDGGAVYRWGKTLGYLYQSALRAELSETLGVRWSAVRNGAADLAGLPPAAIEVFSKRRAEILAATAEVGSTSASAAQTATLATRAPKHSVADLDTLRQRWIAEAAAVGLDPGVVAGLTGPARRPRAPGEEIAARLLGPDGLTAASSSFDRRHVFQALAAASPDGATYPVLAAEVERILARPEVALLSPGPAGPRYSTTELLGVERGALDAARRSATAGIGVVGPDALRQVFASRPSLAEEQRAMVAALTTSGAGVQVVVGRAGAGKTFALDAARHAWELSGQRVIGAALAARAAAELQAGAGIASTTLDRLLVDLDRPGPLSGLAPRSVVVCDEAGMVGTRKLARLLAHADRAGAAVVLVGDPRQLPEIHAGGLFAALATAGPTIELVDNRRQAQAWERAALGELRSGSVPEAVAAYTRAGRITLTKSAEAARQAMVADWWDAQRGGANAVMYALRRADVEDLNARARSRLDAAGLLGPERLVVAGREFAVGDSVLCLRNDRRLGISNGTLGTVTAVDVERGELTLAGGVRLPAPYLEAGHLGHSYATTVHKSQGATVDRAFLLGSDQLYREAGYVGLSRARQSTQLYLVDPDPRDRDPLAELTHHLGSSRAQTPAHALLAGGRSAAERAALADPVWWMIEALGPPPLTGSDREGWGQRAARLGEYRERHHITDTAETLGPRPEDPERRRAWEIAALDLADRHLHLHHDQGLTL
ncbi:MAG: MobF family relaxase [Acidimicrobiales bacterium]